MDHPIILGISKMPMNFTDIIEGILFVKPLWRLLMSFILEIFTLLQIIITSFFNFCIDNNIDCLYYFFALRIFPEILQKLNKDLIHYLIQDKN